MSTNSDAHALLEKAGLRATRIRLEVLAAIRGASRSGRALSHGELVEILRDHDRVTIYRNLKLLKKAGLVHGVQGIDGILRHVVHPSVKSGCPGDHPHFLCEDCGVLSCLPNQELPRVSVAKGYEVRGKQLLAYGLCRSCADARKSRVVKPSRSRVSV